MGHKQKKCSKCKNMKNVNEFYKNRSTTDGLNCYCKKCIAEDRKVKKDTDSVDEIKKDVKIEKTKTEEDNGEIRIITEYFSDGEMFKRKTKIFF